MMSRSGWLTMMILVSATMMSGAAFSEPVQWAENGHYYEYMDNLLFWEDAAIAAESMSYMGHPGYLATITSLEENEFVYWTVLGGNAPPPLGDPWLGGYQNSDQSLPDENWHWVTEEAWEFTNWSPSEPNDYHFEYAEMYLQFTTNDDGGWNDHHSLLPKAWIVEYSSDIVGSEDTTWGEVKALYR